MAFFSNPFFKSKDKTTEDDYSKGVICLQNSDFYGANNLFKLAAACGHVSALYNLALINGGGSISPYDIDFAIICFRKAADGGHPKAKEFSPWIDKAEDTSFGTTALAMFAARLPAQDEPNHLLMMVGCRLYSALCIQHDALDSVIEYELDAASTSDHPYVHRFVERTGVKESIYLGGLNRIQGGSAADQITDGLNDLYLGLKRSGHSDKLCLMIRCTIVGYIIAKSKYANEAAPLTGYDRFFASDAFIVGDVRLPKPPESEDEISFMAVEITKSLVKKLPTEQDVYWFVIEQYDKMLQYGGQAEKIASNFPISLHEIEYEGRRSESSYVGKPNPGIVYLEKIIIPILEQKFGKETAELIMAIIFGTYCDGLKEQITSLRLKYAVHYHNNCISSGSYNFADTWSEVISDIE